MIQPRLLVAVVKLAGDHADKLVEMSNSDWLVAFAAATTTFWFVKLIDFITGGGMVIALVPQFGRKD